MQLEQLKFVQAYECRINPENNRAFLDKKSTHPADAGEGCYLVTVGSKLVYIGSYKTGLHKRWGYQGKGDIYHFKNGVIDVAVGMGQSVEIWALTLDSIKAQIGLSGNKWINAASVEAYLISRHLPEWNKQGKRTRRRN